MASSCGDFQGAFGLVAKGGGCQGEGAAGVFFGWFIEAQGGVGLDQGETGASFGVGVSLEARDAAADDRGPVLGQQDLDPAGGELFLVEGVTVMSIEPNNSGSA